MCAFDSRLLCVISLIWAIKSYEPTKWLWKSQPRPCIQLCWNHKLIFLTCAGRAAVFWARPSFCQPASSSSWNIGSTCWSLMFANGCISVDWEHWHRELKTLGPVNLYHVLPFQSGGWWGWFTWLDLIKLVFRFWWLATGMTMAKQRTIPGRSNLGDHRTH